MNFALANPHAYVNISTLSTSVLLDHAVVPLLLAGLSGSTVPHTKLCVGSLHCVSALDRLRCVLLMQLLRSYWPVCLAAQSHTLNSESVHSTASQLSTPLRVTHAVVTLLPADLPGNARK